MCVLQQGSNLAKWRLTKKKVNAEKFAPTDIYRSEPDIGAMVRLFTDGPGDLGSIPGRVIAKTQKWYSMLPCSTLSVIRYGSRVKWSNTAPSPTHWCCSYRKGSLRVTLDYGRQLYLLEYLIPNFA